MKRLHSSLLIESVCIEADPVTCVKVAPDKSVYVPPVASDSVTLISNVGLEPPPAALSKIKTTSPSYSRRSIALDVAVLVTAAVATPATTV